MTTWETPPASRIWSWGAGFAEDPGCYQSCRVDFEEDLVVDSPG